MGANGKVANGKTAHAFPTNDGASIGAYKPHFKVMTFAGFFALWGVAAMNGLAVDFITSPLTQFQEGRFFIKTTYTGFFPVDYVLSTLVGMFWTGTNATDEGYQLFLFDLYMVLHLGYLYIYAESLRPGNKPTWIAHPLITSTLWQMTGGGFARPLYYWGYVKYASQARVSRVANVHGARALYPAFMIAAVGSVYMLMGMTWWGPDSREMIFHQNVIAWFQPSVLYFPIIMNGLWMLSDVLSGSKAGNSKAQIATRKAEAKEAYRWIQFTAWSAVIIGSIGHFYVVYRIINSPDPEMVSLVRMYAPISFYGPDKVHPVLTGTNWLYLQWDNIFITSSDWFFLILTIRKQTTLGKQYSLFTMLLATIIGYIAIGPTATFALSYSIREAYLPDSIEEDALLKI